MDRTKRLAERAPGLDIFGQALVVREPGSWSITEKGRSLLAIERPASADHNVAPAEPRQAVPMTGAGTCPAPQFR